MVQLCRLVPIKYVPNANITLLDTVYDCFHKGTSTSTEIEGHRVTRFWTIVLCAVCSREVSSSVARPSSHAEDSRIERTSAHRKSFFTVLPGKLLVEYRRGNDFSTAKLARSKRKWQTLCQHKRVACSRACTVSSITVVDVDVA